MAIIDAIFFRTSINERPQFTTRTGPGAGVAIIQMPHALQGMGHTAPMPPHHRKIAHIDKVAFANEVSEH
ncbi:MAG: hypothetical protein K2X55_13170 [Burkholderiaceae bacterium]|nr:hypothetical protein [Burkholderiaceae bacterium]